MKLTCTPLAALMILMLLAAAACKGGENAAGTPDVPSDLLIIFGQQGTFAGRGIGYTIDGAGNVERWEGKFPGENVQAETVISPERLEHLWHRAEEIALLSMQDQAMSSTYTFVSLSAGGESRRVTWTNRDPDDPTPAQVFYDECMEAAREAFGEAQ